MNPFSTIDWSKVTLPAGMTQEEIERQYLEAAKDVKLLNKEFNIHFTNKRRKANHHMITDNILNEVFTRVRYNPLGEIDVREISALITKEDRPLFKEITKFVYQFFHEKPMTLQNIHKFKLMYLYYLIRAGF